MRIKNNINRTLKRYLFEAPNPPRFKKEYLELKDFIFPCKEIFLAFLDEENFDNQVSCAEKIIIRLSYESFFPAPVSLCKNVLKMESIIKGETKKGYIGRDHYVHVVHLYLLGIYLFLYHNILNESILRTFRNKRNVNNIRSNHLSRSTLKDFIVSWRYFSLYHDLAYPIEACLGNKALKSEEKKIFLSDFNDLASLITKDLTTRGLSKFIAIYNLVKDNDEFTLSNSIFLHLENEVRENIESTINVEYNLAEKIYGYETFRLVYTVFDKRNIISVLYDNKTKLPILIYVPADKKDEYLVYKTIHYTKNTTISKIEKVKDAPFNRDYFQLKNYKWDFYINSQVTLDSLIKSYFPEISVPSNFDNTISIIQGLTSSHFSRIISDSSFKQYCFDIYMVLCKTSGQLKLDDTNDMYFDYLSTIFADIGKEIPTEIGSIVESLIREKNGNINFEEDLESSKHSKDVIYKYLKNISKTFAGFAEEISKPLINKIKTQLELNNNLKAIYTSTEKHFNNLKIKSQININISKNTIDFEDLVHNSNQGIISTIDYIDKKLIKAKLGTFKDDLLAYKPSFNNGQIQIFDHGIYSGLFFLNITNIYDQLLRLKKNEYSHNLMKLAIGIDFDREKDYVGYKLNGIFCEICYAILTHNIYPIHLKNKEFKTKLENNAFAYFAILVDFLQKWDRKYQVNLGFNEIPYNTTSKSFNIEVVNEKIRITEFNPMINLKKFDSQFKEEINSYLDKASDYFELQLGEL